MGNPWLEPKFEIVFYDCGENIMDIPCSFHYDKIRNKFEFTVRPELTWSIIQRFVVYRNNIEVYKATIMVGNNMFYYTTSFPLPIE